MIRRIQIRLCSPRNLIFFSFILLLACTKRSSTVELRWRDDRVVGVAIPNDLAGNPPKDSLDHLLAIQLGGVGDYPPMLGQWRAGAGEIVFEPLIPFTRGLQYEILLRNRHLAEIKIPGPDLAKSPVLRMIYPSQDTVPENLLKFYLLFSKPMRETPVLEHIALLKNNRDTVRDVFLDLQPALWNHEGTMLTLWLDPGRIKRDLKPNQLKGSPLVKGEHYTLRISDRWKDTQGVPLQRNFEKMFVVGARDSVSPEPAKWRLNSPQAATIQPVEISFGESLDYGLLNESLHVVNEKGEAILGALQIAEEEKKYRFTPNEPWTARHYHLQIETRLEDLAGNNIIRLFDRDLENKGVRETSGRTVDQSITIRK